MKKSISVLILCGVVVLCNVAAQQPAARPPAKAGGAKGTAAVAGASFETTVQPFLAKNCIGCHNEKLTSGTLNLQQFSTRASIARDRDRWDKVLQRIKAGEMPPKEMPRPHAGEQTAATNWIEGELDRLDRAARPDPGRVTARRLNRGEYNYTVKDLLGVDFRPADDFPQDDSGYGFDNNGDVLSLSVVQMEKYLAAAESVARTAIYGSQEVKPMMARYQPSGRRRPGDFDQLFFNTHPYYSIHDYDESGLSMPNSFHIQHRFPVTAEYVIRMTPDNGSRPPGSEALEMGVFLDGKLVGEMKVDGSLEGKTQTMRTRVTAGEHWLAFGFPRQFQGLPVAFAAKNPSTRPIPEGRGRRGGGGGFQLPPNATPEQIAEFEKRRAAFALTGAPGGGGGVLGPGGAGGRGGAPGAGGRGGARGGAGAPAAANANNNDDVSDVAFVGPNGQRLSRPDNMRVQYAEIGGPYNPEVKPSDEGLKKIYVCGHLNGGHQPACSRKIVANLAKQAYRRPVTSVEVDELMKHAARAQQRGDSFEEQLVVAIQAMLVSPHFLFRIERDRASGAAGAAFVNASMAAQSQTAPGTYALSNHELASRLSYFLWSSMPDEELMRAADQGTLRKPEVLVAQTRRMLQDPRASRLVQNFGGQWLQIRALESHVPDFYKFPQFDNYLRMSMVKETELFFENIIKEDRNILEFLDADYTFVNEYLAQYYRIKDVKGPEFRKVSLAGVPRRGILGHASVLTVSSYANRTSVVLRGKWILENLLNTPPPPPPANVPDLEQANVPEDASLRERMEAHRSNAVCASCHSKMDPLGFGLENFNAVGNWREKDGKSNVDASGTFPDGRTFKGPVELAAQLRARGDDFARCMTEKMLIYALGRGLESPDRPVVKSMTAAVAANNYRFSSVVLEIVKSMPFQMRRGDRAKV